MKTSKKEIKNSKKHKKLQSFSPSRIKQVGRSFPFLTFHLRPTAEALGDHLPPAAQADEVEMCFRIKTCPWSIAVCGPESGRVGINSV